MDAADAIRKRYNANCETKSAVLKILLRIPSIAPFAPFALKFLPSFPLPAAKLAG